MSNGGSRHINIKHKKCCSERLVETGAIPVNAAVQTRCRNCTSLWLATENRLQISGKLPLFRLRSLTYRTAPQMIPAHKWSQYHKWSPNWTANDPKTGNDSCKWCRKKSRMAWTPWIVHGCIFSLIVLSEEDSTMKDGKNTTWLDK